MDWMEMSPPKISPTPRSSSSLPVPPTGPWPSCSCWFSAAVEPAPMTCSASTWQARRLGTRLAPWSREFSALMRGGSCQKAEISAGLTKKMSQAIRYMEINQARCGKQQQVGFILQKMQIWAPRRGIHTTRSRSSPPIYSGIQVSIRCNTRNHQEYSCFPWICQQNWGWYKQ